MKRLTLIALLLCATTSALAQTCLGGCDPEPDTEPLCISHPLNYKKVACASEDDMTSSERMAAYNLLASIQRRLENQAKAKGN